jgi:hypothetical protein
MTDALVDKLKASTLKLVSPVYPVDLLTVMWLWLTLE